MAAKIYWYAYVIHSSDEITFLGATFLLNSLDDVYKIECCGFVTNWDIDIAATGTLYAEVWRPDAGGTTWTLVGVNTITVNSRSNFFNLS